MCRNSTTLPDTPLSDKTVAAITLPNVDFVESKPDDTPDPEFLDPSEIVRVPLRDVDRMWVVVSICLSMFITSLDANIVGIALKDIVAEFNHQELVPWIGAANLLTSAGAGAIYGKISDLFGRKWVYIASVAFLELGSLLSGFASNVFVLIVGRAVSGLGAGGVWVMANLIITDIVSPKDRGKYQTLVPLMFSTGMIAAPIFGGFFCDHVTWRWCFIVNVPLGCAAIAISIIVMKFPSIEGSWHDKLHRVDFLGSVLLFCTMLSLTTALQLGGGTFPWSSAPVLSLLGGSLFLGVVFMYVELRVASEPVVPASLLSHQSVLPILVVAFCIGASFFAGLYYNTLFFQVVNGDSATQAGIKLFAFVAGVMPMSLLTGFTISRTSRYKFFFYIGGGLLMVGLGLTATLDAESLLVEKLVYLFAFGLGSGILVPLRMLAVQASVPPNLIGVASAVTLIIGYLGGAIGVTIAGTVLNTVLVNQATSNPILTSAIVELNAMGNSVDATQVLELSQLLTTAGNLTVNGTLANQEL
ncbi:hypothetical protein HDU98_010293, partial [Podochytrium sp. JEL0797]